MDTITKNELLIKTKDTVEFLKNKLGKRRKINKSMMSDIIHIMIERQAELLENINNIQPNKNESRLDFSMRKIQNHSEERGKLELLLVLTTLFEEYE